MINAFRLFLALQVQPSTPPIDPAAIQQQAVTAAIAAAKAQGDVSYAKPADVTAAIVAATPTPCPTPAADTLNGSAGTGACMPAPTATRPTAVQRANVITDASGAWTLTWARAFSSATPVLSVKPVIVAGSKGDCGISAASATQASGTCWTYQTVVVSILGASVNPVATAAAGIRVMIVGAEPTQ